MCKSGLAISQGYLLFCSYFKRRKLKRSSLLTSREKVSTQKAMLLLFQCLALFGMGGGGYFYPLVFFLDWIFYKSGPLVVLKVSIFLP